MSHAITPTATRGLQQTGNTRQRQTELSLLGLFMADQLAHTDIESECEVVRSGDQDWFDLDSAGRGQRHAEDAAYIKSMADRADRYLRLRDDEAFNFRVIRNPAFPRLLRFEVLPMVCSGCGCTDGVACSGGCWWIEPDLCSACLGQV